MPAAPEPARPGTTAYDPERAGRLPGSKARRGNTTPSVKSRQRMPGGLQGGNILKGAGLVCAYAAGSVTDPDRPTRIFPTAAMGAAGPVPGLHEVHTVLAARFLNAPGRRNADMVFACLTYPARGSAAQKFCSRPPTTRDESAKRS